MMRTTIRGLIALAVLVVGIAATYAAFDGALGLLPIGIVEATVIAMCIPFCRRARTRRILGIVLAVLLGLAVYLALSFANYARVPDPLGRSPIPENADVYCGSVLRPSNDTGLLGGGRTTEGACAEWRDDRETEARVLAILAAGTVVAVVLDSRYARRRRRPAETVETVETVGVSRG